MLHAKKILATVIAAGALAFGVAVAGAPTGPKVGDVPPEISATSWLNSSPLTLGALKGKVVLLEFWSPG